LQRGTAVLLIYLLTYSIEVEYRQAANYMLQYLTNGRQFKWCRARTVKAKSVFTGSLFPRAQCIWRCGVVASCDSISDCDGL